MSYGNRLVYRKKKKRKQKGKGLIERLKDFEKQMAHRLFRYLDENPNANNRRNFVRKKLGLKPYKPKKKRVVDPSFDWKYKEERWDDELHS